jgi:hypothetical protein
MSQAPAHQFEWWDHIFILHALKVGLAGVLALFFAEALRLEFPQWSRMDLNPRHSTIDSRRSGLADFLRIRIAKLTVGSKMVEFLQKIPVGC